MGLALILRVLLRLVVHDWYYVELTAWALLPYFQYYSVYWFMTGTTCSLLQGLCSYISSTTPSTGSRLLLRGVYWRGLAPILWQNHPNQSGLSALTIAIEAIQANTHLKWSKTTVYWVTSRCNHWNFDRDNAYIQSTRRWAQRLQQSTNFTS
jgi:hypothetical protein